VLYARAEIVVHPLICVGVSEALNSKQLSSTSLGTSMTWPKGSQLRVSGRGHRIAHIREPVSVPEARSVTWTYASATLIQTARSGEVPGEPKIHGRGDGTSEGWTVGIFLSAVEPAMPRGTEGDYGTSKA
jgi:hypothetical protein